jgi:DNA-directed RNA polymerase subunit RPC12/RpoP
MAHQLEWEPGSYGKGLVHPDGSVQTWNTDFEGGPPHHPEMAQEHWESLPKVHRDYQAFYIEPNGGMYHSILSDPNYDLIQQTDPRLFVKRPDLRDSEWKWDSSVQPAPGIGRDRIAQTINGDSAKGTQGKMGAPDTNMVAGEISPNVSPHTNGTVIGHTDGFRSVGKLDTLSVGAPRRISATKIDRDQQKVEGATQKYKHKNVGDSRHNIEHDDPDADEVSGLAHHLNDSTNYEEQKQDWYERVNDQKGHATPFPYQPVHWRHDHLPHIRPQSAQDDRLEELNRQLEVPKDVNVQLVDAPLNRGPHLGDDEMRDYPLVYHHPSKALYVGPNNAYHWDMIEAHPELEQMIGSADQHTAPPKLNDITYGRIGDYWSGGQMWVGDHPWQDNAEWHFSYNDVADAKLCMTCGADDAVNWGAEMVCPRCGSSWPVHHDPTIGWVPHRIAHDDSKDRIEWNDGEYHKGVVADDGAIHVWPVGDDPDGDPWHSTYTSQHNIRPMRTDTEKNMFFYVDGSGYPATYHDLHDTPEGDELLEHLAQNVPQIQAGNPWDINEVYGKATRQTTGQVAIAQSAGAFAPMLKLFTQQAPNVTQSDISQFPPLAGLWPGTESMVLGKTASIPNVIEADPEFEQDYDYDEQRRPFIYMPEHDSVYLGQPGMMHDDIYDWANMHGDDKSADHSYGAIYTDPPASYNMGTNYYMLGHNPWPPHVQQRVGEALKPYEPEQGESWSFSKTAVQNEPQCPRCGAEMIDADPWWACPKCGWKEKNIETMLMQQPNYDPTMQHPLTRGMAKVAESLTPRASQEQSWTPGQYGKGFVGKDGQLFHWPVGAIEDGLPSHYDMMRAHGYWDNGDHPTAAVFANDPQGEINMLLPSYNLEARGKGIPPWAKQLVHDHLDQVGTEAKQWEFE